MNKILVESKAPASFEHSYMTGDCHHFAIALHRLTGAPLVSFSRDYEVSEEDALDENDLVWSEHSHAAVLVAPDTVVDVKGLRKIDDTDLVFTGCNFSDDPGSETKMVVFEDREEDLASYYADYDEELIAQAMNDAKRWGCERIAKKALASSRQNKFESGLKVA